MLLLSMLKKKKYSYIDVYLDIETTGLSPAYHDITVVGIYLVNGNDSRLLQLVGEQVKRKALLETLDGRAHHLYLQRPPLRPSIDTGPFER